MKQPEKSPFKEPEDIRIFSNHVQWIAALAVLTLKVQLGIYVGWASPNFAWLVSDNSTIPTTSSDISWLMSVTPITAAIGSVAGCILMEQIGSRKTIILTYLLMGTSWACLLVADSIVWLYISRTIGGTAYGILSGCFSVYLGEVSAPEIRGTLIVLSIIGSPAGTALGVVAETYLRIKVSSSIYLSMGMVGVAMFAWLRDTPYYLMRKNDVTGAKRSIEFYRPNVDVEKELNEIEKFIEARETIREKLKKFEVPAVRTSLLMVIFAACLPQLCGSLTVKSYMETILDSAKFDAINPKEMVIYSYLISVASVFFAMNLVDRLGRKLLIILSSIGTTLSLAALGLHFYLLKLNYDPIKLQWLPMTSLISYLIAYSIGYEIIPGTLLSEMFTQNIKNIAVCIVLLVSSMFTFVVTKSYQPIVDYAGEAYAFWAHALLSTLGVPYALFWLIETKGKKFHEIQDKLHRKSSARTLKVDIKTYEC